MLPVGLDDERVLHRGEFEYCSRCPAFEQPGPMPNTRTFAASSCYPALDRPWRISSQNPRESQHPPLRLGDRASRLRTATRSIKTEKLAGQLAAIWGAHTDPDIAHLVIMDRGIVVHDG